ncbi:hypothetical protein D3C73_1206930 [compost metagenome]
MEHSDAGAGRAYNIIGMFKGKHHIFHCQLGIFQIAAVIRGLAAAHLGSGEIDFTAQPFENLDHSDPDIRGHQVHYAG